MQHFCYSPYRIISSLKTKAVREKVKSSMNIVRASTEVSMKAHLEESLTKSLLLLKRDKEPHRCDEALP